MAQSDEVQRILEDMKVQLRKALPGMEFFFLLCPMDPEQVHQLGADALVQVNKRMVQHLQRELKDAMVDQRREG